MKKLQFMVVYRRNGESVLDTNRCAIEITVQENDSALDKMNKLLQQVAKVEGMISASQLNIHSVVRLD